MSKRKEKISAFLDNDLHRDELMSFSLSAEDDDAKVAQRYQMVGDALRGELSDSSFVDVSRAVREALADEALVVEASGYKAQVSNSNSNSSADRDRRGFFDLSGWFKPVAGMAVAATVAVVMVTTLSQHDSTLSGGSPLASNQTQVAPQANPQANPQATPQAIAQTDLPADGKTDKRVNPYINQHLEFATQDTLQGRLPYVRAVSYDAEQ